MTGPQGDEPPAGRGGHPLLDTGAIAVASVTTAMVAPMVAWVRLTPADRAMTPYPFEVLSLVGVALLTVLISLVQIFVHIHAFGGSIVRGNRDRYPVADGFAARIGRAHSNAVESLLPFAIAIFAAHGLGVSNRWTVGASALFLAARTVHAITYAAGLTVVRSAAFYAGIISIFLIAAQLPWGAALDWR